ncbi:MAG TPA: DUF1854 domain-containing protein [Capsulimonadaceae bacterium]|nr:DUF1854 domain-containing protein [Capsulimonadaceae bacterium]
MANEPDSPAGDLYDVRFLKPAEIRLFRVSPEDSRVRMLYKDDRCYREVRIARALPLSDPDQYIGLRDGDDKEIGMLRTLEGVDEESLKVIEEELAKRYFLPKIMKVLKVKDQFGIVVWDVETDYGMRRYTVRNMRDNTVQLSSGRVLMTDTDGNRFEFPDLAVLDARSLEVISKVV